MEIINILYEIAVEQHTGVPHTSSGAVQNQYLSKHTRKTGKYTIDECLQIGTDVLVKFGFNRV